MDKKEPKALAMGSHYSLFVSLEIATKCHFNMDADGAWAVETGTNSIDCESDDYLMKNWAGIAILTRAFVPVVT